MEELLQQVVAKARRAVEQLRDQSEGVLDYSESSLSVVDEILAEASDFTENMPGDQIDTLVRLLGSYVLEVGRHEFGGKYYWHEERGQPVLVLGEPDYKIAILTFDKVRSRLFGGDADNIPFFYQRVAVRARTAGPGDDVLIG